MIAVELEERLRAAVAEAMPQAVADVTGLVAIPSVSWPSFDQAPMRASAEAPGWTSQFRLLVNRLDLDLHDARRFERYHHPDDYAPSQALARRLRAAGSNGIVYRSVRDPGGTNVAAFRPPAVQDVLQGTHWQLTVPPAGRIVVQRL